MKNVFRLWVRLLVDTAPAKLEQSRPGVTIVKTDCAARLFIHILQGGAAKLAHFINYIGHFFLAENSTILFLSESPGFCAQAPLFLSRTS
jgi:hypothetical protein